MDICYNLNTKYTKCTERMIFIIAWMHQTKMREHQISKNKNYRKFIRSPIINRVIPTIRPMRSIQRLTMFLYYMYTLRIDYVNILNAFD